MGFESNAIGPTSGLHTPGLAPQNRGQQPLGLPPSTLGSTLQSVFRDRGLVDRWASSSERWSTRLAVGNGLDWAWRSSGAAGQAEQFKPNLDRYQPHLKDISQNAVSYRQLMGLGKSAAEMAKEGGNGFAYHTVSWKDAFKQGAYKEAVGKNFANAFKTNEFNQGLTADRFVKNTLYKDNFRRIADTLTEGKNPGSGLASAAGLGLFAYDVVSSTNKTYQEHKAAERGTWGDRIDTLRATARTFATKTMKNAVAWEVGTAGFAVGASLCCIGTAGAGIVSGAWLPIVGGVAVGALASTLSQWVMGKIVPETEGPQRKAPLPQHA